VEYFFYCRDKPNSGALRKQIVETHWSFMDAYASAFVARGPTLAEDGTQTGSMHIVDLPDAEAVRVFAYEESNYKAGVYTDVFVSRWRNELGRTMWEFKGDPEHAKRFLVIGHGKESMREGRERVLETRRRYYIDKGYQERLIANGPLLSDDGKQWMGSAMMVELPDRGAVDAMLAGDPCVQAGMYDRIEIHNWRFGGRH
jgi:uncharacterized protein YciI